MTKRDGLIFAAGIAVGGVIGWFLAKDHYTNLEIKLPEMELPEKKEWKSEQEPTVEHHAEKAVFAHDDALKKEDLNKLAEKYRSKFWDNPPSGIDWETGDAPSPKEGPADMPYIIPEEEFSEGRLDYDKVTLYYHAMDNTLIEEGIPYEEFDQKLVEDSIGEKNINALKSSEDGIIYVRNEGLGIDYMIIMERDSYGAEVLGVNR